MRLGRSDVVSTVNQFHAKKYKLLISLISSILYPARFCKYWDSLWSLWQHAGIAGGTGCYLFGCCILCCVCKAVTTPSMAVSHIMLEAYKKHVLVSLIVHGKVCVAVVFSDS